MCQPRRRFFRKPVVVAPAAIPVDRRGRLRERRGLSPVSLERPLAANRSAISTLMTIRQARHATRLSMSAEVVARWRLPPRGIPDQVRRSSRLLPARSTQRWTVANATPNSFATDRNERPRRTARTIFSRRDSIPFFVHSGLVVEVDVSSQCDLF